MTQMYGGDFIDLGKGGDVELLPPQTGIVEEKSNYSYNLITL